MISEDEAKKIAQNFLLENQSRGESELMIGWDLVRVKDGILIAPYNSARYWETLDIDDQMIGCWPILVELATGHVRFSELKEMDFWDIPFDEQG